MEIHQIEVSANIYTVISFIVYIFLILLVGILSAKYSSKGITEFFLGGRKINKFVVGLSAVASGRSSWLLLGLTGMAYLRGVSAIWAAAGYIVAEYLMFIYAAPRLRAATQQNDDLTIPDYFESRFHDKSHILRLISACIIIIFMSAYISAQFVGGGKAFSASFGIDQSLGIFITAVIVLIYTLLGGFLAVSVTDVIQACFMLFALLALPVIALIDYGGLVKIVNAAGSIDSNLIDPFSLSFGVFIGFLGIGLGSPGNPHILVRYMSIKDPRELKFSAYLGTFWNTVMAVSAVAIGVIGRVYFQSVQMLPNADQENLFPYLSQNHLHPILFGIIIASILAAIMSTADSMLLVSASAVIRDIYQKIIKPGNQPSEKQLVFWSRGIILFIVAISLLFGFWASDLVFWLVLFAWGGLGAAFGPVLLLSLFWNKITRNGAAAGIISGLVVIIIWNQVPFLKSVVYELVPAFFISLFAAVLTSLIGGRKYISN